MPAAGHVVLGQLFDRVVRKGSCSSIAKTLWGWTIGAWIFDYFLTPISATGGRPIFVVFVQLVWAWVMYVVYAHTAEVRRQMAARDGVDDHAVVCGSGKEGICCDNLFCQPCVLCFLFKHDVLRRQPGATYVCRADLPLMRSRRRRGCDVDIPSTSRGGAAAATWIFLR